MPHLPGHAEEHHDHQGVSAPVLLRMHRHRPAIGVSADSPQLVFSWSSASAWLRAGAGVIMAKSISALFGLAVFLCCTFREINIMTNLYAALSKSSYD